VWCCSRQQEEAEKSFLPDPFIAQSQTVTLSPGARQVAPEWLNPYIAGHYWLEVANDVFNDIEYVMSCHLTTLRMVCGMAPSCWVIWHYSGGLRVVNRAIVVLWPHYSRLSAHLASINDTACLDILHAHDGSGVRRLGNMCACLGNTRA
jgi:hypothetical protein